MLFARSRRSASLRCLFFFFQAEDGIRDTSVTGVQTCALPIWRRVRLRVFDLEPNAAPLVVLLDKLSKKPAINPKVEWNEIGRASCRERVEISVGAVTVKKKKDREESRTNVVTRSKARYRQSSR